MEIVCKSFFFFFCVFHCPLSPLMHYVFTDQTFECFTWDACNKRHNAKPKAIYRNVSANVRACKWKIYSECDTNYIVWNCRFTFCRTVSITVLPKEGPVITGEQTEYQIGDTLNINCTSGRSHPYSTIQWFINDEPVRRIRVYMYWIEIARTLLGTADVELLMHASSTSFHFQTTSATPMRSWWFLFFRQCLAVLILPITNSSRPHKHH